MKILSIVQICGRLAVLIVLAMTGGAFAAVPQDYDGDGKTDLVVTRSNPDQSLTTYILRSRDGFKAITSQGFLLPFGDFDGDGKTDLFSTRSDGGSEPLFWTIVNVRDESTTTIQWGLSGDYVIPQDYNGDGKTDLAVYRGGTWYIRNSGNGRYTSVRFGEGSISGTHLISDEAFAGGDFDGDGKADLVILRRDRVGFPPISIPMTMFVRLSRSGTMAEYYLGNSQSTGVLSGDYDGDGRADVTIWQGGEWTWIRSTDLQYESIELGTYSRDLPAVGDYDGDGKYDPTIYRRGNGGCGSSQQSYFYTQQSRDGLKVIPWGLGCDTGIIPLRSYFSASGA